VKDKIDKLLSETSHKLTSYLVELHAENETKLLTEIRQLYEAQNIGSRLKTFVQRKLLEQKSIKGRKIKREGGSVSNFQTYWERHMRIDSLLESMSKPAEENRVINLSSKQLSSSALKVLNRGLTYCPNSRHPSYYQIMRDITKLEKNMRNKEYFSDLDVSFAHNPLLDVLPPNPERFFFPEAKDPQLNEYFTAIRKNVKRDFQTQRSSYHSNLNKEERAALAELETDTSLTVKPADKGGCICVLDTEDYTERSSRVLDLKHFYRQIPLNMAHQFLERAKNRIEKAIKGFDKNVRERLLPDAPKFGRFYTLPKIHKENVPMRPIVSCNGTITEHISSLIDYAIKEIPSQFKSYIKDTNDFLEKIKHLDVPQNCLLATMDVVNMYPSIPHEDGIRSTLEIYSKLETSQQCMKTETLESLLRVVLEHNVFEFNSKYYIQTNGTAIGTKMAPAYANIFMGVLEEKFLNSRETKPLAYFRFIDDIFILWDKGQENLESLIQDFGQVHPNIKFSNCISSQEMNFLDVTIKLENGKLSTKLYRKPTDNPSYLHYYSEHPKFLKHSIPYSLALRCRRLCTNDTDAAKSMSELRHRFQERKYPLGVIDDALNRAWIDKPGGTRNNSNIQQEENSAPRLITTFHSNNPKLQNILKEHHNILSQSEKLAKLFPAPPQVVFRRAKNLKDRLVHARTTTRNMGTQGSGPCGRKCKACNIMKRSTEVRSSQTNFQFKIKGNYNCLSTNIVYLLECNKCHFQYIGETKNEFRVRLNGHRSDYNLDLKAHENKRPMKGHPLAKHFIETQHRFSDYSAYVLQSGFTTALDRKCTESHLIHKFSSFKTGLNQNPGVFTVY
jgi:hypothetical protein